jgi:hypothetical protein
VNKLINFSLILLMLTSSGCFLFGDDDGGTTTGNPATIDVNLAAYDNSFVSFIRKLIIDDAQASISNLQFCFKRIRFKTTSNGIEYNYNYNIGQIEIQSSGTSLNDVTIQKGTYTRVEFDLEKNCDGTTKPSVYLANGNGNFQTDDRITIKFDGSFTIDQTSLSLFVTNFTNALKTFNQTNDDIKPTLEALSGSF